MAQQQTPENSPRWAPLQVGWAAADRQEPRALQGCVLVMAAPWGRGSSRHPISDTVTEKYCHCLHRGTIDQSQSLSKKQVGVLDDGGLAFTAEESQQDMAQCFD